MLGTRAPRRALGADLGAWDQRPRGHRLRHGLALVIRLGLDRRGAPPATQSGRRAGGGRGASQRAWAKPSAHGRALRRCSRRGRGRAAGRQASTTAGLDLGRPGLTSGNRGITGSQNPTPDRTTRRIERKSSRSRPGRSRAKGPHQRFTASAVPRCASLQGSSRSRREEGCLTALHGLP